VKEILKSIPENYYRYTSDGKVQGAGEIKGDEEIIGGGSIFKAGKKILFEDNFSEYEVGDIPSGWEMKNVSVEVANFKGKKWMRFLAPGQVKRKIDIPENYSVEFSVYIPTSATIGEIVYGNNCKIYIGGPGSELKYNNKGIKTGIDRKKVYKVSLSNKNGIARIFLDGKKIYQVREEAIKGKASKDKELVISTDVINLDERKECLITDVRISQY